MGKCFVTKLTGTVTVTATNVVLTVPAGTVFTERQRYDIILSSPVPVAGYSLPVIVMIDGAATQYPVTRLGLNDVVFGQTIKCDCKLILYFTNNDTFTDLRHKEFSPCNCNCCKGA